ncbi:MAG TPA: aldo/keto reductase [Flavitalea sp.]|nr:aldo/keto reductase [Flavitalea sp.]
MQYNQLGKSQLRISRVGFGCMSLKPDQKDFSGLISRAVESGINYFDTADLYDKGMNETEVGRALKSVRKKVILATKAGNQWNKDGTAWTWNPSKAYILQAAEQSLQRLQTDYIDLFQLHGGTIEDPIDETIEAFEILQQQGKIRYYGISSIRPNVIRAYITKSQIVSVMMQYSVLDRRPEEDLFPLLRENEIGVLARGTIAGGLLVNKSAKPYLDHSAEIVAKAGKTVGEVGPKAAVTAIQFALHDPAVTAAVVGIRTPEQLDEAIQADIAPPLPFPIIQTLKAAVPAGKYTEHK